MQLLDHPIQYLNIESVIIILPSFHDRGKFLPNSNKSYTPRILTDHPNKQQNVPHGQNPNHNNQSKQPSHR